MFACSGLLGRASCAGFEGVRVLNGQWAAEQVMSQSTHFASCCQHHAICDGWRIHEQCCSRLEICFQAHFIALQQVGDLLSSPCHSTAAGNVVWHGILSHAATVFGRGLDTGQS